jgi:CrcB protein
MRTVVGVAVAGALGALARYGVGAAINHRFTNFPWGTLVVNITGSSLLGLLFVVLTERSTASAALRSALTIGFVGAYTTFSTFSFETVRLLEDGALGYAAWNVLASVMIGLGAAWLGIATGRVL